MRLYLYIDTTPFSGSLEGFATPCNLLGFVTSMRRAALFAGLTTMAINVLPPVLIKDQHLTCIYECLSSSLGLGFWAPT